MSILKVIKERRSIRSFTDQNIPEKVIDDLIEAIRWAPSAGNLQSRKFFFVFNEKLKRNLAGTVGNKGLMPQMKKFVKNVLNRNFVAEAPLVIVACLDRGIAQQYGKRGVSLYGIQDVAASIMNMMLTAHSLGLGSVWVGGFDEHCIIEIMQLSQNLRPVALIPIGYPKNIPMPPKRKTKEETAIIIN